MKIEINSESKAKFFAHYWGFEKIGSDLYGEMMPDPWSDFPNYIKDQYLILKPFSSVTDEEAVEVARIALYDPTIEDWNADEVWTGEGDFIGSRHSLEVGMRCWQGLLAIDDQSGLISLHDEEGECQEINSLMYIVDHLRSKGYALPWMGLSVDQMVEAGWIKLKNS